MSNDPRTPFALVEVRVELVVYVGSVEVPEGSKLRLEVAVHAQLHHQTEPAEPDLSQAQPRGLRLVLNLS